MQNFARLKKMVYIVTTELRRFNHMYYSYFLQLLMLEVSEGAF
jgi:hypothetical protein